MAAPAWGARAATPGAALAWAARAPLGGQGAREESLAALWQLKPVGHYRWRPRPD